MLLPASDPTLGESFCVQSFGAAAGTTHSTRLLAQERLELTRKCSSSRTCTRHHRVMSGFERGNRLFSRYRRKRVEEFVEAMIASKIVDEVPERHSGADKNGRTPRISGSL